MRRGGARRVGEGELHLPADRWRVTLFGGNPREDVKQNNPFLCSLALFICLLTRGLLPLKPPTPRGGDRLLWLLRPDGVARPVPDGRARTAPGRALARPGCRHSCFTGNIRSIAEGKLSFGVLRYRHVYVCFKGYRHHDDLSFHSTNSFRVRIAC